MAYRSPVNQENFSKFTKQTQELKIGIVKILPLFASKKGWADTERSLQKLNLHFKNVETPYIYQKPLLFRRLALCLNQREEGIHQTVFDIYERILSNIQKNGEFPMDDLFFITTGLFFYLQNHLYQQNKRIYGMIRTYFLPLKTELGPMVPALLTSLFPGLIENNQEAERQVYEIIYALFEALPKAFVYSSIWLVLFRSPASRFGALKFMSYHLGQQQKQALEVFDDEFIPENQIVPSEMPGQSQNELTNGNGLKLIPVSHDMHPDSQTPNQEPTSSQHTPTEANREDGNEMQIPQHLYQPVPPTQYGGIAPSLDTASPVHSPITYASEHIDEWIDDNSHNFKKSPNDSFHQEVHSNQQSKLQKQNTYPDHQTAVNHEAQAIQIATHHLQQIERDLVSSGHRLPSVDETVQEDLTETIFNQKRVQPHDFALGPDNFNDSPQFQPNIDSHAIDISSPELAAPNQSPELNATHDSLAVPTTETELPQEFAAVEETDYNEYEIFKAYTQDTFRRWQYFLKTQCKNEIYPHKTIVIQALIASLSDENHVIVQKTLDFIILFMPLKSGILTEPENIAVLQSCLKLLERNEYSIKRRVFKLIFPGYTEDRLDEVLDEESILLVVKGMRELFQKSFDSKDISCFKILQTIFMERDVLIEPIVTGIAKPALHLISLLPADQRQEVGSKFFMTISAYFYIFLSAYVNSDPNELSGHELKVLEDFGSEHIEFTFPPDARSERIPADLLAYHNRKVGAENRINSSSVLLSKPSFNDLNKSVVSFFALFDEEEDELEFEGNNIAHLIRMKLFEGSLKLINAQPFNSETAIQNLMSMTQRWPDLHFNSKLTSVSMNLLAKFKNSLNVEALGSISENAFEYILRLSVYLLKKLNENSLTNEWAASLELFLNKSTDNPLYVLASIRGITELISSKRSEMFRKLNEAAIKSAWRLMDDLRFHNSAFILINELARTQLTLMLEILELRMRDDEIVVRIEQLQRIIIFWKVAAAQSENYNIDLDEALTCILLDHIEDLHPVLRQLAKSWLFDSSAYLDRILDPIVRRLLNNCHLFVTVNRRVFHVSVFSTQEVMSSFKRLNIVVNNNPLKFASFVLSSPPSKSVEDTIRQNEDDDSIKRETYSDVLLSLGMRFLRASVLPFMGRRFRQDNLLVSTAACELLEVIIKLLQSHSPGFLTESLVEVLLRAYYQFVTDEIPVMQVNMINLLKVILFQSGFLERNKRNLSLFERIFREKRLLENVIGSIQNNRNSHTLLKIVDFLDTTIQIFSSGFFPENKLKDVVSLVFESYFNYIAADQQPTANQNKFDSIVVLVEAVFKFVDKYFNLEEFEIPDRDRPRPWKFFTVLTFGLYRGAQDKVGPVEFKLIEAYLLDYFDKIMIVLLKGWKVIMLPENAYHFCNLGPYGFDEIHFQAKQGAEDESTDAEHPGTDGMSIIPTSFPKGEQAAITNEIGEDDAEGDEEDSEEADDDDASDNLSTKIKNNQDTQLQVMTEKMYYKYPKEFMESLLKAWITSQVPVTAENAFATNLLQVKIIDLISHFNFPIPEFNKLLMSTEAFRENKLRSRRNKGVLMSFAGGSFECSILALYYGYLKHKKHSFIEDNDSRKQQLRTIWYAVCEFLQEFIQSSHPQVDIWIINIYHLCARKFPTQEIIGEYSIKKLIHVHENDVLEKIVAFVCEEEKTKLPFERPGNSENFSFVYPLPTLIVDLAKQEPNVYLSKLTSTFEEDFHLRYYTKIIALKALKALTMELLRMTYENKTNNRIARRVKNIITRLFVYIESLLRNKLAINENLYVEIIEYLFIFLEDSRDFLMDAFQAPIERFFDSDLFFECPSKSLMLWAQIIYWQSAAGNKKILNKYLYNEIIRQTDDLFSSEAVVSLLEEMRNILLNPASKSKIVIIVLFCLRIILLKASVKVCVDVLKFIWPIAFMHIIMSLNNQVPAEDFNVKLASLKLLEVVSLKAPELFYANYWIIGVDGVGIEYEEVKDSKRENLHTFASPFMFVPFLSKVVKRQIEVHYRTVENESPQPDLPPMVRERIVSESRVDSDEELSEIAQRFLHYMSDITGRVLTPIKNMDEIIVEDFKRLNDFSLKQ